MRKLKDLSRYEMNIISRDYAYASQAKSGEYFAEKYNISMTTFYNVLHKVVLEAIVPENIAQMIANKAASNNYRHGGDGAKKRTLDMYEELMKARKDHRLGREEAKKWTLKYLESELDLDSFAEQNFLDVTLLKRALYDAVVKSWIDNEAVEKLKEKTKKQKEEDVEGAFEKMLEKRKKSAAKENK